MYLHGDEIQRAKQLQVVIHPMPGASAPRSFNEISKGLVRPP
jgi:hypothetical protein